MMRNITASPFRLKTSLRRPYDRKPLAVRAGRCRAGNRGRRSGAYLREIVVSWIIVSRATGKPVLETFSSRTAGAVDRARYEVLTALQWLQRFNATVREQGR